MWPDLPKFRHFGKSLQLLGKILDSLFFIWKMLSLLWQICDIVGLIFSVPNSQTLKKNLTIWSHGRCLDLWNWNQPPFRLIHYHQTKLTKCYCNKIGSTLSGSLSPRAKIFFTKAWLLSTVNSCDRVSIITPNISPRPNVINAEINHSDWFCKSCDYF